MRKIIHHIRRQPEEIKRHILHISTVVAGIILILLWIYSLGTSMTNPDTEVRVNNDLKPFSALRDNLIGGYKSISEPNTNTQGDVQQ